MKILTTPNKALLEKVEPVIKFDNKLKKIITEMSQILDATRDPVGVGLAAPQVGIPKRFFLAKPEENGKTFVFINPVVESESSEKEIPKFANSPKVEVRKPAKSKGKLLEGCLSIPSIWGNVSRKKSIKLSWQDINGRRRTRALTGFPAIIIQHEIDHLDGILFTKHVLAQGETLYRSHKNKEGADEFEEIEV